MRLYLKVVLVILVTVILTGVSSSLLVSRVMRQAMEQELEASAVIVTKMLAEQMTQKVINNDILIVLEIIGGLPRLMENVEYAYVVGFDGKVFVHSFEGGFPRALGGRRTPVER